MREEGRDGGSEGGREGGEGNENYIQGGMYVHRWCRTCT